MNLPPVRSHGETKAAYHERLRISNRSIKHHLRHGYHLWTSCYLLTGKEMLGEWLSKHPGATEAEVEQVRKNFPENKLFKVKAQGTYHRPRPKADTLMSFPAAPASSKVLAALKKHRRKKAQAESRRISKLMATEVV